MSVTVQPNVLEFPKSGGNVELVVTNSSGSRKAIMVRANNFIHLIISPYYAIIEPQGKTKVNVIRNPGALRTDQIFIAYKTCTDGMSPEKVFENCKEADGELTVDVKISK
ncbi:hypothetical protein M3Y94_01256200 [Aphelenchoides besseyi]|nr:hypothetical protein M3Y94_01256200 [Aphelenchoides besseyi]KAI6219462.1 Major sperm protein [Aphelenchoides besseyi]